MDAKTTRRLLWLVAALLAALSTGFLAAVTLGAGNADPARTVTIDVATGPQGPQGPTGPQGPPGSQGTPGDLNCPAGYSGTYAVINAVGGHFDAYVCMK